MFFSVFGEADGKKFRPFFPMFFPFLGKQTGKNFGLFFPCFFRFWGSRLKKISAFFPFISQKNFKIFFPRFFVFFVFGQAADKRESRRTNGHSDTQTESGFIYIRTSGWFLGKQRTNIFKNFRFSGEIFFFRKFFWSKILLVGQTFFFRFSEEKNREKIFFFEKFFFRKIFFSKIFFSEFFFSLFGKQFFWEIFFWWTNIIYSLYLYLSTISLSLYLYDSHEPEKAMPYRISCTSALRLLRAAYCAALSREATHGVNGVTRQANENRT